MSAIDLPVIDFTDRQRNATRFIDQVVAGIEGSPGILQIANPPVDWSAWERAQPLIHALLNQPVDKLVGYMRPEVQFQRGVSLFGAETARGCTNPDLKSFWMTREPTRPPDPKDCPYGQNVWPTDVPGFRHELMTVM